ncbi:MAG: tetratricopeptide repeat protein [Cyanobacteria bacterium P01_E01_bin.6]
MTDSTDLTTALQTYDTALHALTPDAADLDQRMLTALTQRDAIQSILNKAASVSAAHLTHLDALDTILKSHKNRIVTTIDQGKWRSLLHIPDSSWWWHFEPPALVPWLEKPHPWLDRFDWLWKLLSLFALTFSFTVVLDTLSRVSGEGLNTNGMFPVVVQVILTILGGTAALTTQGQALLESAMTRLRIPKHYWQELSLVVSVVVLVIVVTIHEVHLPNMARTLYVQGIDAHTVGQFDTARQLFQQAIALQPDFMEAHYNLGTLYEDLQETDEAVSEYQLVVKSDVQELPLLTQLRAHNNLGRLYLIQGDYRAAWVPLERGLALVRGQDVSDPTVRYEHYNLLKNLGWVRVEEAHYIDAELYLPEALEIAQEIEGAIALDDDLKETLGLKKRPVAASCLYAQVLDGMEEPDQAESYWKECLSVGRRSNVDEAQWMAIARERLTRDDAVGDADDESTAGDIEE